MFSLFSGVYDAYFAPTKLNLLIVGAGGAGKTALLERMKCTQFTRNKKIEKQQVAEYLQREVPGSFLPPQARGRASSFSSNDSQRPSPQPPKEKPPAPKKEAKKTEQKTSRLSFLKCPAPMRYQQAHEESESDSEEDDKSIVEHDLPPEKPDRNGMDQQPQISQESMQEVSLKNDAKNQSQDKTTDKGKKEQVVSNSNKNASSNDNKPFDEDKNKDDDEQCDLKPKSKMLPLHKIRPTIGMNLGKVEICGAQCHVWDLGGRMIDLWSRYYQDCDAVIFVWKIVEDIDHNSQQEKNGDDDSDDEDYPFVSAAQQLELLEQVRKSIPDDVPFLIWGHWFPTVPRKNKMYTFNQPYSTGSVIPHYHNPLMSLFFGSAKSGAGVRQAMEWLIPIAARQKKVKEKSALEAKEEELAAADSKS